MKQYVKYIESDNGMGCYVLEDGVTEQEVYHFVSCVQGNYPNYVRDFAKIYNGNKSTEMTAKEYLKLAGELCREYRKAGCANDCSFKNYCWKNPSSIDEIELAIKTINDYKSSKINMKNDLEQYQQIGTIEEFKALKDKFVDDGR